MRKNQNLLWIPFGCLCVALAPAVVWAQDPAVTRIDLHPPSDSVRFYHAQVDFAAHPVAYDVASVVVNGNGELFVAKVDGQLTQYREDGGIDRTRNGWIPANMPATFFVRCPWVADSEVEIVFHCKAHAGEDLFEVHANVTAPAKGGFPFPGWKEHRLLVLRDDDGLPRSQEPYLFFLSDEAARVGSWEKELRVAKYDLDSGAAQEIPSQVLYEKRRFDTPEHEAAYATCQAAILVEVPANGKAYYLIAYGNSDAALPHYETDLKMEEKDGAILISNSFYDIQLHGPSGQLHGFASKTYGTGENHRFGYMPDSGYTLHYNPDVWVKNRSWTHTHGWNPPPKIRVEAGPVCIVTRRWGHLPRAVEVEVEVVYHFFSGTPYILVESTMDIMQDVVVNALRNEEVVFSPATEVDHAGWMRSNGDMGYKPTEQEAGLTPGMVQIIEPDAPFVCLTREADGLGMASIRLAQHAGSRGTDPPVVASSITVLADYGWDFRYWSRSLVYPWGDYVPDQPSILNAGSYYGEKSAFCLFPIGEGDTPESKLKYVADLSDLLSKPVRVDHQGAGPW